MRSTFGLSPLPFLAFLAMFGFQATVHGQDFPVSSGRKLAAHALKVIEPNLEWGDTSLGPVDLAMASDPDLAWTPNYAPTSDTLAYKSTQLVFRNEIYCLEFAFKPVRMIEVNGRLVWYMLYRVRYTGGDMRPVPEPDKYQNEVFGKPQGISAEWVRFLPTFKLDTLGRGRSYLDRPDARAKQVIAAEERVGAPIYDSLDFQNMKIKLSTPTEDNAVWGVATWQDVDAETDFFSVHVRGLTNAQKMENAGGEIKYLQKILVLHFFRPGDRFDELEDTIRYGMPALVDPERQKYVLTQFGQEERLEHIWVYR